MLSNTPFDTVTLNGIIYKVTHIHSGRIYIGQTYSLKNKSSEQLLAHRKTRHLRTARGESERKTHFHQSLNKYGFESFIWEVVAIANNVDDLNRMEAEHIKTNSSSSDENGFNTRIEGENKLYTAFAKKNMSGAAKSRWDDMPAAERKYYILKQQKGRDSRPELKIMSSTRMKAQLSNPEYVELMTERRKLVVKSQSHREKMSLVSKEMWLEKSDEAKVKALAQLDSLRTSPLRLEALRKKLKTSEYLEVLTEANRNRRKRKFQVTTLSTNEVIGEFENIVDAALYFGNHAPNISVVLNGKGKSFLPNKEEFRRLGRLFARWCDDSARENMPRFNGLRKKVTIIKQDTGEQVAIFDGVRIANSVLGRNISAALHGRTKSFTSPNPEFIHLGKLTAFWLEEESDDL